MKFLHSMIRITDIDESQLENAREDIEWSYEKTVQKGGTTESETEDALETLRDRYARGELTDEEFERRVERLLETESVSDAVGFRSETAQSAGREPERE
jgi:3-hydroxyacyl-CoA dehydrogenase